MNIRALGSALVLACASLLARTATAAPCMPPELTAAWDALVADDDAPPNGIPDAFDAFIADYRETGLYDFQTYANNFLKAIEKCGDTARLSQLAHTINAFFDLQSGANGRYSTWLVSSTEYVLFHNRVQFLHLAAEAVNVAVRLPNWSADAELRQLVGHGGNIYTHYNVWSVGGIGNGSWVYEEYDDIGKRWTYCGADYLAKRQNHKSLIDNLILESEEHLVSPGTNGAFKKRSRALHDSHQSHHDAQLMHCFAIDDDDLWMLSGFTEILAADMENNSVIPQIDASYEMSRPEGEQAFVDYYRTFTEFLLVDRLIETDLTDFSGNPVNGLLLDPGMWRQHPDYAADMYDPDDDYSNKYDLWLPTYPIDHAQAYSGDYDADGRDDFWFYDTYGLGFVVLCSTGFSGSEPVLVRAFYPCAALEAGAAIASWTRLGDYNGDGRADIWQYLGSGVGWRALCPNGTGSFTTCMTSTAGPGLASHLGDYNGDGRQDLWQYLGSGSGWRVLCASGSNGLAQCATTTAGQGIADLIGDYDGDGDADLWQYTPNGFGNGKNLRVLCSNRTGGFTTCSYANIVAATTYRLADYNGDAKRELFAFVSSSSQVTVYCYNATYGLTACGSKTQSMPADFLAGKFSSDNLADVMYWQAGNDVAFLLATTGGSFSGAFQTNPGPNSKITYDVSHYRRMVHVIDSLITNPLDFTTLVFALGTGKEKIANQYAYKIFNKNLSVPLFANNASGNNGWYRVGYDDRVGFGYDPHRLSFEAGYTSGYGFWAEYNGDIATLRDKLRTIYENRTGTWASFWNRYYKPAGWSEFRTMNNNPGNLTALQFYPVFAGLQ